MKKRLCCLLLVLLVLCIIPISVGADEIDRYAPCSFSPLYTFSKDYYIPKDTLLSIKPGFLGNYIGHHVTKHICFCPASFIAPSHGVVTATYMELTPEEYPSYDNCRQTAEPTFVYTPNAGYTGWDQFEFVLISGGDNDPNTDEFAVEDHTVNIYIQPPKVSFNKADTAICEYECYNPAISAVVSGLGADQKVNLQLTYQILYPSTLQNEKKYIRLDNVGNGEYPITPQMFGVTCLWPGIPSESSWSVNEEKIMEMHFGANLLDSQTGNCITQPCTTGSQDYYWYPWVCGFPPVTPEFPSLFLPVTMIIGFLGAVLYIQRTREQ